MERRRGRAITMILLLLLGGAIVNVAVAWGLAVWAPHALWLTVRKTEPPKRWPYHLERAGWPPPVDASRSGRLSEVLGITAIDVFGPSERVIGSDCFLEIRQFGFPFRSMQWENAGSGVLELLLATETSELGPIVDRRNGVRIKSAGTTKRALPLTLIWPGVAINTIFYAAILGVLFFAPGAVRRASRRRRGLCLQCAYPIGTSDVCTECGALVVVKLTA